MLNSYINHNLYTYCSLGSHKMKASALGIYAVLSTAARYISSTPLGYVNCFDKQYSAKYYILQATNWLTHGYGQSPRRLYVPPSCGNV